MQYRRGQEIDVTVERLALEGHGVGRLDGLVVFVEKGLPGERVRARVRKIKRNFIQARSLEVLEAAPERVPGRCSHLSVCGGCSWQELAYEAQLRAKTQLVQEALERLGGFRDIDVPETLASPQPFFYRNKMEYTFFAGRDGQVVLGLHMPGAFDRVFDVDACFLMSETSNRVLARARELTAESGLPAYHSRRHEGFWRHLVLRESKSSGDMLVNFVTHEGPWPTQQGVVAALTQEFPEIRSLVRTINTRKATIAQGEREEILHGPGEIEDCIGDLRFKISAASFFQPNPKQAQRLFALATEWAACRGHEEVLDLYAGTGTISLFLARKARRVTGIELGEGAVVDAQRNAALNGIDNCRFVAADVRRFLRQPPVEWGTLDVVIADPPRAGLHPDVVQALRQLHAPRLVYVSCNPSTLARDLQLLCRDGLYALVQVQPVDMFPHTYHVETVARLEARNV
jgi:23S rRNA (uracil1939-C5)-methyltransferase